MISRRLLMPVALDVGRATFGVSLKVELVLAVTLVAIASRAWGWEWKTAGAAALLAVLLAQQFLLLPILDARALSAIAANPLARTWHHMAWIVLDAGRLVLLLVLAVGAMRAVAVEA